MALCGIGLSQTLEGIDKWCLGGNFSTRLMVHRHFNWKTSARAQRRSSAIQCSSSRKVVSEESVQNEASVSVDDESDSGHVIRFNMGDFKILDRVSIGLSGRADEVVFEAIVKDSNSPLHNTKVVLRQLISVQAQRRGRRAIEVLKKLVRRRLMYHSYSMQVHGYVSSHTTSGRSLFTLVHGYHGSFSLRHWLQQADWLPTLEATLALDEESVRKVGDDSIGGPAASRQLRLIRLLMRDLLIGVCFILAGCSGCTFLLSSWLLNSIFVVYLLQVNYLHSHGLAHTELRLENVHISPVDRHIKVGILGNAADFYEDGPNNSSPDSNMDRRQMMIAFDMRCVGFMMAKMVLRELMDPLIFTKFKSFLTKGIDPSCLREFLLQVLNRNSSSGNTGFQILDRNWGAGWNLLSLLLATKPSKRISCLDALRHPFLCGPRWRVDPSIDMIRWGLGSSAVRITEEYIYRQPQRARLAYFVELMEMLNPHSKPKNWLEFLPGKWRMLYCTGRHIGLTLRQPPARILVGYVRLTVTRPSKSNTNLSFTSDISFTVMTGREWPHDKTGITGKLQINSLFRLMAGRRLYIKEEKTTPGLFSSQSDAQNSLVQKLSGRKWRKAVPFKDIPSSLSVAKLVSGDIELTMSLGHPLNHNVDAAKNIVQEVRTQIPPEMFDLSKFVCGTYVDSRFLVLRGVNGSALLFTRSWS
ncbi:putative plastid-lipid-associated protein 14 [Citrus sinensis]|uniref:Plastid-lipid-associated protein 14 n=1 Tax=Citrus sinensis TaxID=2711 RepID=A0ACB8HQX1_CITSI|nr:putative plastid-lipid-associated protein 14 [Citrus sinensis]